MPYADRDRQRAAARESARRRRLARQGATSIRVEPLNRGGIEGELVAMLRAEIAAVRAATEPGNLERSRVLCLLVSTVLKCVEAADLRSRLEQVEDALAKGDRTCVKDFRSFTVVS